MEISIHTPSAGGVVIHDDKVLVITSKSRQSVELPKGTIEHNNSIEETAIREVKEETGYDVSIDQPIDDITFEFNGSHAKRYRKTVTFFLMHLQNEDAPQKNLQAGEDFENEWLTLEEATQRLTFDDVRMLVSKAFTLAKERR